MASAQFGNKKAISPSLFGRLKIYTAIEEFNAGNIVKEVNDALKLHMKNYRDEEYLYWYRRGKQPILDREKEVRPEICNRIVVNNANQVVVFKNGYFLTKPAFYISRRADENITEKVRILNEYLYNSGKHVADNKTVNWFHTVGLGNILVEPNRNNEPKKPVSVHSLDPRTSFVVYSLRPGNEPVYAVNLAYVGDKDVYFDVFTKDFCFRLKGEGNAIVDQDIGIVARAKEIISVERNQIGEVPIIEYQYNEARMGAFESAIPIMDEINLVESNRADGVEQFIQSLCVGVNISLPDGETANTIRERGMIVFKSVGENKADFKILNEELDQAQTQVTLDNLYFQMAEKCGMPYTSQTNGGTSDNVGSVYLRNGWATTDTDCRNTEDLFRESNSLFDRVFLKILKIKADFELNADDFELQFTRNNLDNLLVKTQAAMNMKSLGLAPQIALERSGLSNDPQSDIEMSKDYIFDVWKNVAVREPSSNMPPEEEVNGEKQHQDTPLV